LKTITVGLCFRPIYFMLTTQHCETTEIKVLIIIYELLFATKAANSKQ